MKTKCMILNSERNVSLTAYIQPVGGEYGRIECRPAVLIIPGGGYHFCSDREAEPVAFAYLKAGYQAFVLRYSLNEQAAWPHPLDDYEQAMALIRENSTEWHVAADHIAVIGFSAGGHLAACAATMSKNRPNAAVLGYPVIDGICARDYLPSAPDVIEHVDGDTCPCFVFATRTDNLVPVSNAVHMVTALCENDIAFESHIYSNGHHGLSTGDAGIEGGTFSERYPHWVEDSISWLADVLGGITPQGLTSPRFGAKVNGNRDKALNLDCTMAYLMASPSARDMLNALVPGWDTGFPSAAAGVITLRDGLSYRGLDPETIARIEAGLNTIDNRNKDV